MTIYYRRLFFHNFLDVIETYCFGGHIWCHSCWFIHHLWLIFCICIQFLYFSLLWLQLPILIIHVDSFTFSYFNILIIFLNHLDIRHNLITWHFTPLFLIIFIITINKLLEIFIFLITIEWLLSLFIHIVPCLPRNVSSLSKWIFTMSNSFFYFFAFSLIFRFVSF